MKKYMTDLELNVSTGFKTLILLNRCKKSKGGT